MTHPDTSTRSATDVVGRLYDLCTWRAFDIDDDGRMLAGWDDLGMPPCLP
jgi:hypothetical protein